SIGAEAYGFLALLVERRQSGRVLAEHGAEKRLLESALALHGHRRCLRKHRRRRGCRGNTGCSDRGQKISSSPSRIILTGCMNRRQFLIAGVSHLQASAARNIVSSQTSDRSS